MNIKTLLLGAIAAGMLVGCTSSDIIGDGQGKPNLDENGEGYVKLAINLPTVTGTRADYGDFVDGDKNEYTVENAILAIFDDRNSTNEMDYVLLSAYDLSLGEWKNDDAEQISTHREIVRKVEAGAATGNLHGYVILNRHNFFSLDGTTLTFNPNCSDPDFYNHHPMVCNGLTLAEFASLSLRESGRRYDANSFLMTNMPYVNYKGGNVDPASQGTVVVKNLYPLSDAIFPTEAAANVGKGAEINVERVLAKVETTLKEGVAKTEHNHYDFKFLGWFIDNTNPNAFIGRHTIDQTAEAGHAFDYLSMTNPNATFAKYRMVSADPIDPVNQPDRFRSFWALDPNYNTRGDEDGHDKLITVGGDVVKNELMHYNADGENDGGFLRASGSHYYCTENTFDVEHQSVSNTTRIIVAAQFIDGDGNPKSFYTLDREPDQMFDESGIINYTKARIAARASFMMWAQDYFKSSVDATKYLKVQISAPEKGYCKATLKHIAVTDIANSDLQETDPSKIDAAKADAVTAFNKMVDATDDVDHETGHNEYLAGYKIGFFANGVSYYQALIKHFGEYDTPWSVSAHAGMPNDVEKIYDNNDKNKYLGRYGVVRNNWYKIEVEGIRQIGSPIVPPVPGKDPLHPTDPDTPDDTVDNYLKVKVNIMPWAIRKQNVVL